MSIRFPILKKTLLPAVMTAALTLAPSAYANDIVASLGNPLDGLGLLGLVQVSVTNTGSSASTDAPDTPPADSSDPANAQSSSNDGVVDLGAPALASTWWTSVTLNLVAVSGQGSTATGSTSIGSTDSGSTGATLLAPTTSLPTGGTQVANSTSNTAAASSGNSNGIIIGTNPASPEPSEWVLTLTGLGLIGFSTRRSRAAGRK
jgi:hypothetical protein